MYALFDDERKMLLTTAGMLIAGALAVLPLTFPPRWVVAHAHPLPDAGQVTVSAPSDGIPFPQINVERDPFVPLVSDAAFGRAAGGAVVIRAVVVGDDPRALVERKGEVRVLAIGDAVGTQRIVAIDALGIILGDGTRLTVEKELRP